jgi:DNA-binding ferritin-like protein
MPEDKLMKIDTIKEMTKNSTTIDPTVRLIINDVIDIAESYRKALLLAREALWQNDEGLKDIALTEIKKSLEE